MPKKPKNNATEKPSDISPSDPSPSDAGDGIDDLILEPISSRLPGKKTADSIPPKQETTEDTKLTHEEIDDISLDDIKIEDNSTSSPPTSPKKKSYKQKSTGRMYPSGKEVDLTAKPKIKPTTPKPESEKNELPATSTTAEETVVDDDTEELVFDEEPLPEVIPDGDTSNNEDPTVADEKVATSDQEDVADSPPRDTLDETEDASLLEPDDFDDDLDGTTRSENLSVKKVNNSSLVEKISLGIFILLLIVGLAIYVPQMIPKGQLTSSIVDVANTPINLDGITIETLEAHWTETLNIKSRVRRDVEWTPAVELAISGAGSGAFRILFLDQDGRQRGDTMDIAFADGKFQPSMQSSENIYCTHGLTSELELKDLRARGDSWWTIRVLKGKDVKAPSSEFETIIETKIPFKIVVSKS